MIDDDIDTGDEDFLEVLWNDTAVSARILKCLVALWLLSCFIAILLNFIK